MSLHWYACISINTYCFGICYIPSEMNWWALSNTSSIVWICLTVHKILANETFTVTDSLISQLFVVTFVHPTYVQIALIWSFPLQLSLWKSAHLLWKYKLNEVCNTYICGRALFKTFQLVGMDKVIGDCIKLKTFTNNFLNKFS